MIKNRIQLMAAILLVGFVFLSCDNDMIYEENFEVDAEGWHEDDVKTFNCEINDTLSPMRMFINFRTSTDYPYSNLFMFFSRTDPAGMSTTDTLQFILAAPNGEWQGESSGTVVENRFLISQGVFERKGNYQFGLQQAMRDSILPEVLDVGLRIELWDLTQGE